MKKNNKNKNAKERRDIHDPSVENAATDRAAGSKKDHESKGGEYHDKKDRIGKTDRDEENDGQQQTGQRAEKPTFDKLKDPDKGKIAQGKGGTGKTGQNNLGQHNDRDAKMQGGMKGGNRSGKAGQNSGHGRGQGTK